MLDRRRPPRGSTHRPSRRALVGALLAVAASTSAVSADESHTTEDLVSAALEVYNEFSDSQLPYLDREQLTRLADHEVVRVRRRGPETAEGRREEAVGYILVEAPRRSVWLAALDPAFEGSDLLTEVRLSEGEDGSSIWYQHADLPWPISDRHWVIHLAKSRELAERTKGFVWEHHWELADNGAAIAAETVASGRAAPLTPEKVAGAIYLPHNQGAWTAFSLERDRTLVVYRVSTDVGGSIPESWIATFAMAQLEGLLRRLEEHTQGAAERYDPDEQPITDGFGEVIGRDGG